MDELPQHDVMDSRGRMRRVVLAFVVGVVAAAIAFAICDRLAQPDAMPGGYDGGSKARAYGFVYYVTALVGAVGFSIALAIQNHLAKKKWRRELTPEARARKA